MKVRQLYVLFIILLQFTCIVRGGLECLNLQLSVSQKVENEGFHRNINWLIESTNFDNENWRTSNCEIALQLDVPPEMFVNPDEILNLNRTGQISAYIDGSINVEAPAHESTEHKVYIYLKSNSIGKVSVELPVHLRYQRAVIGGGFGKINLSKPSLLVLCPIAGRELCGDYSKVTAPCDSTGQHLCVWQNVTYQALFDDVQLFVPVGDLDDYPIVSVVTLLLGCFGSIYILSLLSTMSI
ncbi:hypothetical protein RN001_013149 [Aquatica leii]|uniref:Phosphatidylinositol-glycan biosynthesis class X protein n=1 Tax=Aquatica leii TaxID=1421715 RepID=A0AAN7NZP0_9COLE|nr:hypothetical protein RN001_013149 [Aquatica leii]